MAGDAHGDKTQEEPQAAQDERDQQAAQGRPQVSGVDWEKAIVEHDGCIAELEAQVADSVENADTAEALRADIADDIRGQNGLSVRYQPGDMATAKFALEWDVGLKPRTALTSLGTLELNYADGRHCHDGGVPVNAWEVDPGVCSSASVRPYDDIMLRVQKVLAHSSWPQVGMTNASYLFNSFQNMTEVSGFENLSGITRANQMLVSCTALETIYATSFSNSGLSGPLMFNGCNRLVRGTDGFVPSSKSGAGACKLGAGGVLTDPNDCQRHWFWAHCYADGEGVLTAISPSEDGRELLASERICAEGKYVGLRFTPWDGVTGPTHRQHLTSATYTAGMARFSSMNPSLNYLFCSCTNLTSVIGLGSLSGVRSMRFTFALAAVVTLDFRGFDPSTLTDLYYTFSGCNRLTTVYADSGWAPLSIGLRGSRRFYNCSTALVGGNGTVCASNKMFYTYFRIDTASTPGYITVL